MIRKTIENIEAKVKSTSCIEDKDRDELLKMLSALEAEVLDLSKTHPEQAESITGFAQVSAHEAPREQKHPQLLTLSIKGLTSSIEGFENSHTELVKTVNNISVMLSSLGI
jgi:hypothetical protein